MKKMFALLATVAIVFVFMAFKTATPEHSAVQGAHCNGTVVCNCPGFSPITNGYELQKAYCRYCNHARNVHK